MNTEKGKIYLNILSAIILFIASICMIISKTNFGFILISLSGFGFSVYGAASEIVKARKNKNKG
jgi:hypothetical protein